MAKKKKPIPDHDRRTLLRDITEQVRTMILRAEHLRDAGKLDQARRPLVRIERLTEELKGPEG
jgi:hypothetical protein